MLSYTTCSINAHEQSHCPAISGSQIDVLSNIRNHGTHLYFYRDYHTVCAPLA